MLCYSFTSNICTKKNRMNPLWLLHTSNTIKSSIRNCGTHGLGKEQFFTGPLERIACPHCSTSWLFLTLLALFILSPHRRKIPPSGSYCVRHSCLSLPSRSQSNTGWQSTVEWVFNEKFIVPSILVATTNLQTSLIPYFSFSISRFLP